MTRLALWGGLVAVGFIVGWMVAGWRFDATLARAEARIEALHKQRIAGEARINQLEAEVQSNAMQEPVVVERCLAPSRVRRLNQIND